MDFEYLKWFLLREREREWWVFLLSQDWFKGAHSLKFWKAGWYVWFYFYFVLGSFFWNFLLHSFLGFWSILLFSWNFFCRFINFFYPYVGVNSCGVSKLFLVFWSLSHIFMEVYIWVSKFKNGHWASSLLICVPLHDFSNLYVSSWVLNFFCYSMKFE